MKKLKLVVLAFVMIISSLFLVACDKTYESYTVNVNVWYSNYGIVYGSGTYQEEQEITITAKEKNNSTFIAWIKNDHIVSYDKDYTFKVDKENSGYYTAVFTCPEMDLATLKLINYAQTYSNDEIQITSQSTSIKIGSSYGNCYEIYTSDSKELTNTINYQSESPIVLDSTKTLYGIANLSYTYKVTENNETVEKTVSSETKFEFNLTDLKSGDINLNMPQTLNGTYILSFQFDTLTTPKTEPEQ